MKKLFLLFALVGMNVLAYSQDVKVNINNLDTAAVKDNCPYRINGICATEDIGGVDVKFSSGVMALTNYNNFPVNVLWQIQYRNYGSCACSDLDGAVRTGYLVLGVEGQKQIFMDCCKNGWSITGLIVRKLAQ